MSKNLFQLIKKLSSNEKGYFKKVTKVHSLNGNSISVRLFDILDKQVLYNKKEVDAFFGNKKTIVQLPVISNYLYYLILDMLEEFHAGKTIESQLKTRITNAEQLYTKGLYEQARVIINKAKVQAEKGENFLLILQIYAFEGRLSLVEEDIENLKKYADALNSSQKLIYEKFKNYNEYRELVSRIFYLSKRSGRHLKSQKDQLQLEQIMKHPLLSNKKFALSVSALSNFLLIHSYYNDIKKDRDISKSIKLNMERLQLMETNIEYIAQSPVSYLSLLNNLLLNAGETFHLDLFRSLLDKLKNANSFLKIKSTSDVESLRYITYLKYSIFQSFISADFQEGVNFIKGKENLYFKLHKDKGEEDALVYCHNLHSLFFGIGDFKKSMYWINKFLQSGQETLRMELWVHINWANIIVQTELKNFEYADLLLSSFIRFINKHPKEYLFEKLLAKALKNYIDTTLNDKQTEQLNKLKQLKTTLYTYKKSGLINDVDFVFILPWVKSKLEKRPFQEMYKKSLSEFTMR